MDGLQHGPPLKPPDKFFIDSCKNQEKINHPLSKELCSGARVLSGSALPGSTLYKYFSTN
jgi:hypothetical protein